MIKFTILFYLIFVTVVFAQMISSFDGIAFGQILGFDGVNNGHGGRNPHRADCLLVSGTTDCILYQSGAANIILVQ